MNNVKILISDSDFFVGLCQGDEEAPSAEFPADAEKDVTDTGKYLPGSTGPKQVGWVADDEGYEVKLFVRKGGNDFNPGQVEQEFWANQMYRILDLEAPDCKLYPGKGKKPTFQLCKWIEGLGRKSTCVMNRRNQTVV